MNSYLCVNVIIILESMHTYQTLVCVYKHTSFHAEKYDWQYFRPNTHHTLLNQRVTDNPYVTFRVIVRHVM